MMLPGFMRVKARTRRGSFSLVELLAVLAIVSILAVLSASAFAQLSRTTALSTGAQIFIGALDNARQTAITRDNNVEFRLYQLPTDSGTFTSYGAFQTFLVLDGATNAVTKMTYFPKPVVVSSTPAATSLVSLGTVAGSTLNQTIPVYQNNYNALIFRFTPKGGTTLDITKTWYATLILQNDPVFGAQSLPKNFATIQIDPFSGRAKVFRP